MLIKKLLIALLVLAFSQWGFCEPQTSSKSSSELSLADLSKEEFKKLLSLRNLKESDITAARGRIYQGIYFFSLEQTIQSSGNIRFYKAHNFQKNNSDWKFSFEKNLASTDSNHRYIKSILTLDDSFIGSSTANEIADVINFYVDLNEKLIKDPIKNIMDPRYYIFYYNKVTSLSKKGNHILLHTPHKVIKIQKDELSYRVLSVDYIRKNKKINK